LVLKKREDEKILVTPTLIRELPVPIRNIVGDLPEVEKVLIGLDLTKIEEEEKRWISFF
jgi:circadian clock protein KaiB